MQYKVWNRSRTWVRHSNPRALPSTVYYSVLDWCDIDLLAWWLSLCTCVHQVWSWKPYFGQCQNIWRAWMPQIQVCYAVSHERIRRKEKCFWQGWNSGTGMLTDQYIERFQSVFRSTIKVFHIPCRLRKNQDKNTQVNKHNLCNQVTYFVGWNYYAASRRPAFLLEFWSC